jgi:hypothetical protein
MSFSGSPQRKNRSIPIILLRSNPMTAVSRIHLAIAAAAFIHAHPPAAAVEIHVSPAGDDRHAGTAGNPLATPQAARDKLRGIIAQGLAGPVEIILAGGTYRLGEPLELRPEDSGTREFPITWKAAQGAEVVELPPVVRQRQTRHPRPFSECQRANPFLYATGGDIDHAIIDPALVKESWGRARDAQINIVPAMAVLQPVEHGHQGGPRPAASTSPTASARENHPGQLVLDRRCARGTRRTRRVVFRHGNPPPPLPTRSRASIPTRSIRRARAQPHHQRQG